MLPSNRYRAAGKEMNFVGYLLRQSFMFPSIRRIRPVIPIYESGILINLILIRFINSVFTYNHKTKPV